MNIEVGKFYITRGGKKVRIYATDAGGRHPVHGSVCEPPSGAWEGPVGWAADGRYIESDTIKRQDDIIGEWVEPHPLAKAKRGDLIWVKDFDDSDWLICLFVSLMEAAHGIQVVASCHSQLALRYVWDLGKPYVPGENP